MQSWTAAAYSFLARSGMSRDALTINYADVLRDRATLGRLNSSCLLRMT